MLASGAVDRNDAPGAWFTTSAAGGLVTEGTGMGR